MLFSLTTTNGTVIRYQLLRTARKNIIVRPQNNGCLRLNVPPFVDTAYLKHWLAAHEDMLLRLWLSASAHSNTPDILPDRLWFQGTLYPCRTTTAVTQLSFNRETGFALAAEQTDIPVIRHQLRDWLQQQARDWLLPQLAQRAQSMNLQPAAMALSKARTLWGVCRMHTGIRINWRLIGAPDWVVDYVCVHELCHLVHPNHSAAFWTLVVQHTPHTQAAKQWLKTHGQALFTLDT